MITRRLILPHIVRDAVVAQARDCLPDECCGFLTGTLIAGVATASAVLPLVNARPSPTTFATDPRSVFDAVRTMRAAGSDLVAIYHSHPTADPIPSRTDLAENTYGPDIPWLIVGLTDDEPAFAAWRLWPDRYEPVPCAFV